MSGGYSRWQDALVALGVLKDFTLSPKGQTYLNEICRAVNAQTEDREQHKPPGFFPAIQNLTLSNADPIYVSGDVLDTVEYAMKTFEPEPVQFGDPFTQIGFALFPRPLLLPDHARYEDAWLPVRAVSWVPLFDEDDPEIGCFYISYYVHADDDTRYSKHLGNGEISDPRSVAKMKRVGGTLSLAHMFQWSFNDDPWESADELAKMTGETPEAYVSRARAQVSLIQVFWRLGQQFYRAPERAPRGIWRDARRRGVDKKDVTVIKLRRAREAREYEPTGRELTVRHVVRGYWRWQNYRDGKRQIWISPYVRGDESLPFKLTERVYEFVR